MDLLKIINIALQSAEHAALITVMERDIIAWEVKLKSDAMLRRSYELDKQFRGLPNVKAFRALTREVFANAKVNTYGFSAKYIVVVGYCAIMCGVNDDVKNYILNLCPMLELLTGGQVNEA